MDRAKLDRLWLGAGEGEEPAQITCVNHPGAGQALFYRDGVVRTLCTVCGFEVIAIKASDSGVEVEMLTTAIKRHKSQTQNAKRGVDLNPINQELWEKVE